MGAHQRESVEEMEGRIPYAAGTQSPAEITANRATEIDRVEKTRIKENRNGS